MRSLRSSARSAVVGGCLASLVASCATAPKVSIEPSQQRVVDVCLINDANHPYSDFIVRSAVKSSQNRHRQADIEVRVQGSSDIDEAVVYRLPYNLSDAVQPADLAALCGDVNGVIVYSYQPPPLFRPKENPSQRIHMHGYADDFLFPNEQPGFIIVILATQYVYLATAHELGHAVSGPDHADDKWSLMHYVIDEKNTSMEYLIESVAEQRSAIEQGRWRVYLSLYTKPALE